MAAEEWEGPAVRVGRDMVPEALAPDSDWAAVEWVPVEAPEARVVVRALAVVVRAADCGNPAACRAAGALLEPVARAVALEVAGAPAAVGERELEADRGVLGPGRVAEVSAEAREVEQVLEDQEAAEAPAAGRAESAVLEVGLVREAEVAGLGEEPAAV